MYVSNGLNKVKIQTDADTKINKPMKRFEDIE